MLGSGTSVSDSEEDLPSTEKSKQDRVSNSLRDARSSFCVQSRFACESCHARE